VTVTEPTPGLRICSYRRDRGKGALGSLPWGDSECPEALELSIDVAFELEGVEGLIEGLEIFALMFGQDV
jgi:hypothetical protein